MLADGTEDTTSIVLWLQLDSEMVDVRLDPSIDELADRGSLAGCSIDDLRAIAGSEASTGRTTCTPIETDGHGRRRATAEWITRRAGDIALHPVTAYPEPGLLEWTVDGSVMIERAPSGAYVETWHRAGATGGPHRRSDHPDGSRTYRTGDIAVLVRDRSQPIDERHRLDAQIDRAGSDRETIARLVGCEFSIAEDRDGAWVIAHSTFPWRVGEDLHVDP